MASSTEGTTKYTKDMFTQAVDSYGGNYLNQQPSTKFLFN